MKNIRQMLADTSSTDAHGSARSTTYELEPTMWLKEIVDAAQKLKFFEQAVSIHDLPKGTKDLVIPYRTAYIASGDWNYQSSENAEVTGTDLSNLDGATITPADAAYAINISYQAIRTNAVNLIQAAKQDLSEHYADVIDQGIVSAFNAATDATSSARGMQMLFGGDATTTATLRAGDILTTDLIVKARQRLMDTSCYYWSGGSEAVSSQAKNPWVPTAAEPFILFIGIPQEHGLLKDSQFINAAEYGNNEIILNGEIGKYLGVKVVSTVNTTAATTWGAGAEAGHTCYLVKAKRCAALAYGLRPNLSVVDWKPYLMIRIILHMAYGISVIHPDAIVQVHVTDE